jgi:hypothetical protein
MIFVKALYNSMDTGLESMQYMPLITPYEFNLNPETGIRENTPWVKVEYKKNHTIISK